MGDSIPHFMGVLVVAGLLILWILTILGLTGLFSDIGKKNWLIFILLVLSALNYIFFHNGRWKKIIKEFENETEKQRKKGRILVILFTIFTILLFISSLFYLAFK